MKCVQVLDGVGQVRVGDAIWPVGKVIVAIVLSALTLGCSAGLSFMLGVATDGIMAIIETSEYQTSNHSNAYLISYIFGSFGDR